MCTECVTRLPRAPTCTVGSLPLAQNAKHSTSISYTRYYIQWGKFKHLNNTVFHIGACVFDGFMALPLCTPKFRVQTMYNGCEAVVMCIDLYTHCSLFSTSRDG